MESIPEHEILRFHPDTMQKIRKMYNLDRPGEMDNAITIIEEWLKKQHHLTKREYPRSYLERSIILQKGSLERTKMQINNICSMRTLLPDLFTHEYIHIVQEHGVWETGFLPTLTEDNYRVIGVRFIANNITWQMLLSIYKNGIRAVEYITRHDYCCGFVLVLDFRDVNIMDYVAVTNLTNFYHMIKIMMVGYSLRIKGIHVITASKAVNTFVNLSKKMINSKVSDRIHLHTNVEDLYEYLPRDILPSEFGGYERSLASLYEEWKVIFLSEKLVELCREMSQAKSTDAHKMRDAITNSDLGVSGSFRSLNVD